MPLADQTDLPGLGVCVLAGFALLCLAIVKRTVEFCPKRRPADRRQQGGLSSLTVPDIGVIDLNQTPDIRNAKEAVGVGYMSFAGWVIWPRLSDPCLHATLIGPHGGMTASVHDRVFTRQT